MPRQKRKGYNSTLLSKVQNLKITFNKKTPGEGFEPPTKRLTAARSTTELPRNRLYR